MNPQDGNCHDAYQHRLSAPARSTGSPDSVAKQHRFAWRSALGTLASPMIRLHQLRNIRTQMLREALGDSAGCNDAGTPGNDA